MNLLRLAVLVVLAASAASGGPDPSAPKAFIIEHPLDPKNMVLRHYCLEGPVVQNVYNGTIILDYQGNGLVELPPYFDLLNADPQYTLTPVGAPMPKLHVSKEIKENRFWIGGGAPRGKVCWEVKARRNDRACVEDLKRRPVEQPRSALKKGQLETEAGSSK